MRETFSHELEPPGPLVVTLTSLDGGALADLEPHLVGRGDDAVDTVVIDAVAASARSNGELVAFARLIRRAEREGKSLIVATEDARLRALVETLPVRAAAVPSTGQALEIARAA